MTTVQYADVRSMVMVHKALRREFGLLPALVRGVPDGDRGRFYIVDGHIAVLTIILQAHHQAEDAILWPILRERAPEEITPIVHVVKEHHDEIDQLTKHVKATLAGWRDSPGSAVGESLADALDRLIVVLEEHFGMEEERILPIAAKHVTATEWDQMGKVAGPENEYLARWPPGVGTLMMGMLMYEGDPEVVEADMARMRPGVRKTIKNKAPQAYEAHSLRVHGTLPPRSVD